MRKLALHGIGIHSGVGRDASATMGVVYSRLSSRIEVPFGAKSASVAAVAYEPGLSGTKRLLAIAGSALDGLAATDMPWPLPLVFCCPAETDIPRPPADVLLRLCAAAPDLIARQTQVIQSGPRALSDAFSAVERILASGNAPACVLLAIDSFIDPSRLAIAERRWGLRSMDCPDGIVPGEAGVALLCSLGDRVKERPQVVSLATCQVNPGAVPGQNLTEAVERALADAGVRADQIRAVVHDLVGNRGVEELCSMTSKIPLRAIADGGVYAPMESLGQTGAAAGVLGVAAMAFLREKKVVEGAGLCIAGDESGSRSVVVVR